VGVQLFNRRCHLTVAPLDGSEGIEISGLRIVFDVKQTSTSEANTAVIQVYNMAAASRGRIRTRDQGVELRAGYDELEQQLFVGVIKRVEHRREGTEIVTEMECKDGGKDLVEPEFRLSYSRGTSRRTVVADILAAMPHTARGKMSADGLDGALNGRMAFSSSAKQALDRLARSWGFEWSIQDGALQILDPDGTVQSPELAFVLNESTGLIGSPSVTGRDSVGFEDSKPKKGKAASTAAVKRKTGARFQSLLLPSLRPGGYVLLQSEFLAGAYKAESCEHKGDTHGQDWTTDVEAKLL